MITVTDVRLKKINSEGKIRAIASITIDESFVVRDIKVIEGQNGLFIVMPNKKLPDGEYRDVAHPIVQEARDIIQEKVLAAYEAAE